MADIKFRNKKDGTIHTINLPDGLTEEQKLHAIGMYLDDPNLSSQPGPVKPTDITKTPTPEQIVQPVNADVNAPNLGQRIQNRIIATMPKSDDTGFFAGLQRGAMGLINPILHPTQMISPQYANMASADKAAGGPDASMARMQGNPISRAAAGDISGLVGEQVPNALLAATAAGLHSPKVRATVREGVKGAAKTIDPTGLRGKLALVGAGGAGYGLSHVGKILGGAVGAPGIGEVMGATIGAGLPMSVGGIKGAIQGFRSAPWMSPTPEVPPPVAHPSNIPLSNSGVEIRGGRPGFPIVSGDESTPRAPSMQPIQPDLYSNMGGAQIVGGPNVIGDRPPMPPATQPYGPNAGVETMGGPRGNIMVLGPDDPVGYQPPKINLVPSYEGSQIYPHLNDIIRELDFRARNPSRVPITDQKIMRDVRKGLSQETTTPEAKAPDDTKIQAPNDLKEKKPTVPEKKQFSAEKSGQRPVTPPAKTETAPKPEQKTVTPPKKKTAPDPKDVVAGIDKELKTKAADPKKPTTTTPEEAAVKPGDPNQITSPETAPLKDKFTRGDIAEISNNLGVTQSIVARHLIGEGYEVEASKFDDNWGLRKRGIKGSLEGEKQAAEPKFNLKDPKYAKQLKTFTDKYKKKGG